MWKSKFSESQIIKILREAEGGRKVADVWSEYKVSQAIVLPFLGELKRELLSNFNCFVRPIKSQKNC